MKKGSAFRLESWCCMQRFQMRGLRVRAAPDITRYLKAAAEGSIQRGSQEP